MEGEDDMESVNQKFLEQVTSILQNARQTARAAVELTMVLRQEN